MFRYFCIALALLLVLSASTHAAGLKVKLVSITSRVPPGGTVSLVITTEPGAACSGVRQGHSGEGIELPSMIAGADGRAQWSWPILSGLHPVGIRTVSITCAKDNRQGSVATSFDVRF